MNFQQLRIIRETVRRQFNLTEVAHHLATSQSGVSKHIKDLEDELGVALFVRRGKRLLDLTEPGREIVAMAERILTDAGNIKRIAEQMAQADHGQLTIATTHMQARYALPRVVAAFRAQFPNVQLVLHQSSPPEIAAMLVEGRADIGIATEMIGRVPELVAFPYYRWHHAVVVPKGHPLETAGPLSLAAIAAYPVITYHQGFTGRPAIDRAFEAAGEQPSIVMEAIDADVIKAYVELGLGIGIIAAQVFEPARDTGLALLDSGTLFEEMTSHIAVKRGRFLRGFAYRFMEACDPALTEAVIRAGTEPGR
ncbi:MAG: CysB family HTH-type transcriptional regulator [Beijerinckiaceae bacterium]|nr:CysB family HTH-type transcriptional regulator [Beijerinckiaceae bacterium]